MKLIRIFAALMAAILVPVIEVRADEQSDYLRSLAHEHAQLWPGDDGYDTRDTGGWPPYGTLRKFAPQAVAADLNGLRLALAQQVHSMIGDRWVPVAERIVKVESGFHPNAVGPPTRHGRALGLGQLLLSSARALGYHGDSRGLLNPQTNIVYTVAHMQQCLAAGVATDADMAGCHVAGWANFRSRSHYAQQYRAMVASADGQHVRHMPRIVHHRHAGNSHYRGYRARYALR